MGHIKRTHLASAKVAVPPLPLLELGTKSINRMDDLRVANDAQSQTLASLRDALLPKLLSGEIRVGEAAQRIENTVEAVA